VKSAGWQLDTELYARTCSLTRAIVATHLLLCVILPRSLQLGYNTLLQT
jgi:hypothetical protein